VPRRASAGRRPTVEARTLRPGERAAAVAVLARTGRDSPLNRAAYGNVEVPRAPEASHHRHGV
jgi:hypothetical protein